MWVWYFYSAMGSAAESVLTERLSVLGTSAERVSVLGTSAERLTLLGTSSND